MDIALIRALTFAALLLKWKDDTRPADEKDELTLLLGNREEEGPYLLFPGIPLEGESLRESLENLVKNAQVQEKRVPGIPVWVQDPFDAAARVAQNEDMREFLERAEQLLPSILEGTPYANESVRIVMRIRPAKILEEKSRGRPEEKQGFLVLLELRNSVYATTSAQGRQIDVVTEEVIRAFRRELNSLT
ncbi:MAG: hypothetical protein WBK67_01460, partial [Minisyncoccales bacterium]